jgi:tetratricopeptide (TPR) repeat protein
MRFVIAVLLVLSCAAGVWGLTTAETKYLEGNAFLQSKDYANAVVRYDEALKADADFIPAWQMKMAALDKLGKKTEADACLDKVLQLKQKAGKDGITIGMYMRAAGLANIGEYEKSIAAFDTVLAKDLGRYRVLALTEKAEALLYGLGRKEEAVACYEKALALDKENKTAWYSKGYAEGGLKKFEAALASFSNALKMDDQDPGLWLNQALMFASLKRYPEALVSFDRSLKLDDRNAQAWNFKGKVLEAMGKKDEAALCYDKANKLKGP